MYVWVCNSVPNLKRRTVNTLRHGHPVALSELTSSQTVTESLTNYVGLLWVEFGQPRTTKCTQNVYQAQES